MGQGRAGSRGGLGARERATRAAALRDVWRALWVSRLLLWIGGMGAVVGFGFGPVRHALNPLGITRGFGGLGDLMAAPAARWDAAWYLVIAHYGYRPQLGAMAASRTAFFPLYPLGVRLLSSLSLAPVIAGVLLSVAALAAGLYGLHRLMDSEAVRLGLGEGSESARLVVLLVAFAPMAVYFSAVYSESLYFALSVGMFLCARRGQWAKAASLAALASATRSTGIVLMVPLVLLYLYGPRSDRGPDRAGDGRFPRGDGWFAEQGASALRRSALWQAGSAMGSLREAMTPRYRVRSDALWLALAPVGLCLYMAHLALAGGDALAPFHAEAVWKRDFAGPYGGVWDGAKAAYEGLRQILSWQRHHVYFPVAGGSPFINAGHNLLLFAFMLAAIPMTVGVLRLLPIAYGAYVLAAPGAATLLPGRAPTFDVSTALSACPVPAQHVAGCALGGAPEGAHRAVLVGSGLAMVFFAGEFSTWHWVA